MNEPVTLDRSKLLIGEGVEDQRLFQALLRHLGLNGEIQVLSYGGKPKLGPFLRTLRATHGFSKLVSLGVTRDSDASETATRGSVLGFIAAAAFPVELHVNNFILPGGGRDGALEDLCLDALAGEAVWPCVEEFMLCRQRVVGAWPHSAVPAKGKIQAWLSTQAKPGARLGEAAEQGLIPFDSAAFTPLVTFLRSL